MKLFEEYLEEGIVRKQSPDISRANALFKGAKESFDVLKVFIEKVGVDNKNTNHIVKNVYDVIMELVRAKMILDGYNSSGKGAHEAEVAYTKRIGFSESESDFLDKLRYFRNGILYYGKDFDAEYGEKVLKFLDKIYPKLKKSF